MTTHRSLSRGERQLARSIFGAAIDYDAVTLHNRKWWPFHPRKVVMAPDGDIWFHPGGGQFCSDFCDATLGERGLFIHEMTHVWQAQVKGRWYLPVMRHPFCRYAYDIRPGKAFARYGIEQQAEIVRHLMLLREGVPVPGKPDRAVYEALVPFSPIA